MSNILGNMPPVFGSGYRGVVPAPSAADVSAQNILRADGTWGATPGGAIPSQTGNAGKLLTTDGTNASWASSLNTFQFGDVTLGSSGPSVKSSLSARAPRQGLVFDGTSVTTSWAGNVLGTGDFTASAWIYIREQPAASQIKDIFSSTGGSAFALRVNTYGGFFFDVASTYSAGTNLIDATPYIGKWAHVVYSRSYSGTTTFYVNGVSAATRSPNDTTNYSGTTNTIGTNAFPGTIAGPLLYNRALSASEVVSLYEAGAPAGADYNKASNTGVNTVAFTNSGFDTFSGASTTGFTATEGSGTQGYASIQPNDAPISIGQKFRVRATVQLNSGAQPRFYISDSVGTNITNITPATGSGTYTVDEILTATASTGSNYLLRVAVFSGPSDFVISNYSLTRLGLLLAPDAAQAGGGLTWYDTSGNAANITLPASGVSWNVPSSRVLGGNWTTSGNQAVAGSLSSWGSAFKALEVGSNASVSVTGNSWFSINNAYNNGSNWVFNTNGYATVLEQNKNNGSHIWYTSNSGTAGGTPTFATLATLTRDGNLILNSTGTDGGQKLQVSGTAAISGGIVGTTTNDSAAAGIVGQYAETSTVYGSRITLTTDTVANVASVSLTAGDWDVSGNVELEMSGVTSTDKRSGISTTSASLTNNPDTCGAIDLPTTTLTGYLTIPTPTVRISIASTTTVYLPTKVTFSAGTTRAWGIIRARRVR